jgi:hypothetical protein
MQAELTKCIHSAFRLYFMISKCIPVTTKVQWSENTFSLRLSETHVAADKHVAQLSRVRLQVMRIIEVDCTPNWNVSTSFSKAPNFVKICPVVVQVLTCCLTTLSAVTTIQHGRQLNVWKRSIGGMVLTGGKPKYLDRILS